MLPALGDTLQLGLLENADTATMQIVQQERAPDTDSTDDAIPPESRARQLHRSLKTMKCWGTVLLGFEHRLSWGVALRMCDWAEILVSKDDVQRTSQDLFTTTILRHLLTRIIRITEAELPLASQHATLLLLSGLEQCVRKRLHCRSTATPVLAVVPATARFKGMRSNMVRHSAVGGVTTARLTIVSRGLRRFTGHATISRTLLHVVEQSFDARWCSDQEPCYALHDRLQLSNLGRPVSTSDVSTTTCFR